MLDITTVLFRFCCSPSFRVFFCASLSLLTLASCASLSKEQCQSINLVEKGKRDVLFGIPQDRFSEYESQCSGFSIVLDREKYEEGFNAGLDTYCSPIYAFNSGKEGKKFDYILCNSKKNVYLLPEFNNGRLQSYNNNVNRIRVTVVKLEDKFTQFDQVFKRKYFDNSNDIQLRQKYQELLAVIDQLKREKDNLPLGTLQ